MIAASGDSGSEDCFPDGETATPNSPSTTRAPSPTWSAWAPRRLPASIGRQRRSVWNNCQGQPAASCADLLYGPDRPATGPAAAATPTTWPRNLGPALGQRGRTPTLAIGLHRLPGRARHLVSGRSRSTIPSWPTGTAAGTASAAPASTRPTTAGFFSDTNQGCNAALGRVGPALYAANSADYTDITTGNNDFTDTNGGLFAAADRLRRRQRAGLARRPEPGPGPPGRRRLPVGGGPQPEHRAHQRFGRHHRLGRRSGQRHRGVLRRGRQRDHHGAQRQLPHRDPAHQQPRRPLRQRRR